MTKIYQAVLSIFAADVPVNDDENAVNRMAIRVKNNIANMTDQQQNVAEQYLASASLKMLIRRSYLNQEEKKLREMAWNALMRSNDVLDKSGYKDCDLAQVEQLFNSWLNRLSSSSVAKAA